MIVRTPTDPRCVESARAKARGSFRGLVALACVTLAGCASRDQDQTHANAERAPLTRTVERGPVRLKVTVSRDEMTIADELKLTIEVVAEEGVNVEMPQFGERLSEFTIRDYRKWPAAPADGRRSWKQQYDLDIYLSGEYEIPPVTAKFSDRRLSGGKAGKVIESEITSEPIAIKVNSLLEGEFDASEFRDIKGAVELPVERTWAAAWWIGGIAAAAAVLIALGVWYRRHRAAHRQAFVVPAHRWALDHLDALEHQQLPIQGQTHEYYFLLSAIVREYIERRFSLMAPEQTTIEFLEHLRDHAVFSIEHKTLLREFLQSADMVKFALHEPPNEEVRRALQSAREFVLETIEAEQPQEVAA